MKAEEKKMKEGIYKSHLMHPWFVYEKSLQSPTMHEQSGLTSFTIRIRRANS